ncbi:lysophospholipid acyltransferase family protein [Oceanirhabdus sp. W0125-5]|uniref:lysophospholipid acyltransferase family protein n=1 Tax=Oceanirhabdus sp. W0125-5 TaxID=2999116 RepID=UPI0022F2E30A|nr:lysophospholipid acyltransferase family protein [Oceanirhabdus sp. W0125-5]WBW98702.1 lysophospholipid acyltransferase family protein [Oceanirhabdus sp. W0125-5]
MRKVAFYFFVVINLVRSIFYLFWLKIYEKIGKEDKLNAVVQRFVLKVTDHISKGIRLNYEVVGKENIPDEACLFVSNHQSYFDVLAITHAVGKSVGFVAKEELKKIIYFRYWLAKGNCVFINRKNPREGLKAINEAANKIKNGHSMVIFPEGTRSRGSNIAPFKKGSMKIAIKAGAKIVPVSIEGTYKAYEKTKGFSKVNAKIIFNEPIDTKELSKEELADVHERIRQNIAENIAV